MGAAGVTAGAAALLAPLAIRSSYGHRSACRRSDDIRSRGGIVYVLMDALEMKQLPEKEWIRHDVGGLEGDIF